MTEQEIEIIESARCWIQQDGWDSDSSLTAREAKKLASDLDEIIRKYRSNKTEQ